MNYAVVDLGTNSARLMIAKVIDRKVVSVYKTIRTIRIGQGMTSTKNITAESMLRTKDTLREFKKISREYSANEFYCFATSAVREAANKDIFTGYIRSECGIDIDVISGDMEAVLGFAGSIDGYGGMIDIGGGSTEVMFGSLDDVRYKHSFKIGIVRCLQLFPGGDDADPAAFEKAHELARATFTSIPDTNGFSFTGIGGTATALAAIDLGLKEYLSERVQGYVISVEKAEQLCTMLKSMTKDHRRNITGLEEKRADVIVFGAIILLEFMRAVGVKSITASDRDNQEGYLAMKLGLL